MPRMIHPEAGRGAVAQLEDDDDDYDWYEDDEDYDDEDYDDEDYDDEDYEDNPGGEIQSLLFHRPEWTVSSAKRWAKSHGYRYGSVETPRNGEYVRLRQTDPKGYDRLRFGTLSDREGIDVVYGFVGAPR